MEMTELSKRNFDAAVSGQMTVHDAINYLQCEIQRRNLIGRIEKFYRGSDLRKTLIQGLADNHPEMKRDTIERRVRSYLNLQNMRFMKKRDAIELSFILNLSVDEANQFVAAVSEEMLHWRDPDEIIYLYALAHGMTYREAQKLDEQMRNMLEGVKEEKNPSQYNYTSIIRQEVLALRSEKELSDYLRSSADRLGRCHNNAYHLFTEMMNVLEHPVSESKLYETDEKKLTIKQILEEYLFSRNISHAKSEARGADEAAQEEKQVLTSLQKIICEHWPDETTLSKMKTRKADISRKVLILLFLATDEGLQGQDEEEEPTPGEVFSDLYKRLNDMLILCGFPQIDPRAPFDWLILYCICVGDMFAMDRRMRTLFLEMFGEEPDESPETTS